MDKKDDKDQIQRNPKRYPDSVNLGKWSIEVNDPIGFVVKNNTSPEEYHFCKDSNGWITGVCRIDPKNPIVNTLNSRGARGMFSPVLCDRESVQKSMRKMVLVGRFRDKTITPEEKEELLNLHQSML